MNTKGTGNRDWGSSRISLIRFSEKSYVNLKGTGITFFEDFPRNPLLTYRKNHM